MPVLPKPPSPRAVSPSSSTSTSVAALDALNDQLSDLVAVRDLKGRVGSRLMAMT